MIEVARGELGNTELPANSNRTKYGRAFGWDGVPWCVIFLWWCYQEAGEGMAFYGGAKTASCGTLLKWYSAQGQTVPKGDVQPGDIVILNFHGTSDTEHCGLVVDISPYSWVRTIEGNTSKNASQSNGGEVCLKTRSMDQIVGVCRPQYKEDDVDKKTDYEDHWARLAIERAIQKGVLRGYDDGTIRPDAPVTRAELATILDRLGLLN